MSKKIFVSYKYGDASVRPLPNVYDTRARHYVDLLQARLDANDHINKGEDDGEDMSGFKDETIASNLRDKIYDSSITLVLISKNMRNIYMPEEDQWIPWEISYSLREKTREDRTSSTNAVLAVVIPDENGSYEYFIQPSDCPHCNTITWRTDLIFRILGKNMFNRTQPKKIKCASVYCGREPHTGNDHSYIHPVKWDDFIVNINSYINIATAINQNIDEYSLVKEV
jgi:hypothetical protein